MDRVLALAAEVKADLVLANDPDADRLCVAVPEGAGYRVLTGDQVGVLLADYLLEVTPEGQAHGRDDDRVVAAARLPRQAGRRRLPRDAHRLQVDRQRRDGLRARARAAGSSWATRRRSATRVGPLVRDKDGVSAAVVFAELAAWNRARGRTVLDHLDDIYRRVGLFVTEQVSLTKPGAEGLAEIRAAMTRFRAAPPTRARRASPSSRSSICAPRRRRPAAERRARVQARRRPPRDHAAERHRAQAQELLRGPRRGEAGEAIADARARGLAELAKLRDAHQALLG